MIWLTSLSVILVLTSQYHVAEARKTPSPWSDPSKANNFMNCLTTGISSSPVFPSQEKVDLESITGTIMGAMTTMSSKSSQAQLGAMDMALASALAEIVMLEDAGNQAAVSQKTDELVKICQSCFKSVVGAINTKFITEIRDLVTVLTQEAITEANEVGAEEQLEDTVTAGTTTGSFGAGSFGALTNLATNTALSSSNNGFGAPTYGPSASIQNGAPGAANYGASGATLSQSLTNQLVTSLTNSQVFQSIFRAGLSSQTLTQMTVTATQTALSQMGISSSQASSLTYLIQNSIMGLRYGASYSDYAKAISSGLASGLQASGVLNDSNVTNIANFLSSAYIQAYTSLASQYNIQLSQNTAGSTITTTSTSAISGSNTQNYAESQFAAPSGLATGSAPGGPAPGGIAPGASGAGSNQNLVNSMSSALAASTVFNSVYGAGLSSQIISAVTTSAVETTLSDLGVASTQAASVTNTLQNFILNLGANASASSYAMAIASSVVSGLSSSGILTSANSSSLVNSFISSFSNTLTSVATQYGIQVSQTATSATSATTSATSATSISGANTQNFAGSSFGTSLGGSAAYGLATGGPGGLAPGASGAGSNQNLVNSMSSALAASTVFNSVYGAGLSSQIISAVTTSAVETTLSVFGVASTQAASVTNTLQNSILNLGANASASSYAMAIASSVVSGLSSSGILTSANSSSLVNSFVSSFSNTLTSVATQYGIQVSQSATSATTSATSATSISGTNTQSFAGTSLGSTVPVSTGDSSIAVSSENILTSPASTARIQGLAKGLLQAFGPNGFQFNSFGQGLGSAYAALVNSGMSAVQAQVEVLMESLAAMITILSSAQIGSVNLDSTSSVSQGLSSSLSLALAG